MQVVKAGGDFVVMLIVGLFWVIAQNRQRRIQKETSAAQP